MNKKLNSLKATIIVIKIVFKSRGDVFVRTRVH